MRYKFDDGTVSFGIGRRDIIAYTYVATPDARVEFNKVAADGCVEIKDTTVILPHARVMIHQPMGGTFGQASDVLIAAREIERTRDELYRIVAGHCGQPVGKVSADADRDCWMDAEEALCYGTIDTMLPGRERD